MSKSISMFIACFFVLLVSIYAIVNNKLSSEDSKALGIHRIESCWANYKKITKVEIKLLVGNHCEQMEQEFKKEFSHEIE